MIFEYLMHDFMVYALILGICIGLAASLLSPFLVYNGQSMIADGLSHVAFSGIIFGLLLSDKPIYFAIPFVVAASVCITLLGQIKTIELDSAIGVVSSFSLALGLIIVSLSSGFNRSIESLLVGSILTVSKADIISAIIFLVVAIAFVVLFYRPLLCYTHDPLFASAGKIKHKLLKYLTSALTAVLIVLGVRTVGMLLMSAFVVFPSLISAQISKSFFSSLINGCIISVCTVFISIGLAFNLNIPTGAAIVVFYTALLLLFILLRKLKHKS